jgi:hypothetical protein
MVEGFKSLVLHCYCDECEKQSMACYVSRILFGVGIFAFFLRHKVMGLLMGSLWSTELLATIRRLLPILGGGN